MKNVIVTAALCVTTFVASSHVSALPSSVSSCDIYAGWIIGDPRMTRAAINVYRCEDRHVIALVEVTGKAGRPREEIRDTIETTVGPDESIAACRAGRINSNVVAHWRLSSRKAAATELVRGWAIDQTEWRLKAADAEELKYCRPPTRVGQ